MRSFRLSAALASAAFALLVTAGGALGGDLTTPPEHKTGLLGEYAIRDGATGTAATCRYGGNLIPKLERIAVAGPEVTWPDTDSNNDDQHGKVSHTIIVQRSNDEGATWTKHAVSTSQTAIAHEHTPAPFTKRTVTIAVGADHAIFRVLSRVRWYRPDGSVRGTLKHWYAYARWAGDPLQGTIELTPCSNKIIN